MTVLITGGAGYIGSHAAHAFLDAGRDVVVVDNLSTGRRDLVPDAAAFERGDVGDAAFLDGVFVRHRIEGVLHFAGSIVVPESITDPGLYYRNNTMATLTLAQACIRNGVGRFVFSSTAAVYGDSAAEPLSEDAPLHPINPYGQSKLMVEQMLKHLSAAHSLRYAALRYFNVAGADPFGRSGQCSSQSTHLIRIACEVATGKRPRMALYGTDYPTRDGTCIRDFIHVSDLAAAHLAVYDALPSSDGNLTLNCGNGLGYSVRDVIHALEEVLGRAIPVDVTDRRPGDPPHRVADPHRLQTLTGWRPCRGKLETILTDALRWEKDGASTRRATGAGFQPLAPSTPWASPRDLR